MIGISQFPILAMNNRQTVEKSTHAGCFHCLNIFEVKEIKDYTDKNKTVICPHCGVDSVVSDPDLTTESLQKANNFWYSKRHSSSS